ncbi:hypothetical protein CLF_100187 [Clonorchis sinensis]|uniref:Uncharacterized protein n=1 Tax=Clonorchis sinensis TaxID=79923 RepID=G7Y2W0_CLOSI|nr:hypothetical protein CLF_100187 [Clonorchis sinensis]
MDGPLSSDVQPADTQKGEETGIGSPQDLYTVPKPIFYHSPMHIHLRSCVIKASHALGYMPDAVRNCLHKLEQRDEATSVAKGTLLTRTFMRLPAGHKLIKTTNTAQIFVSSLSDLFPDRDGPARSSQIAEESLVDMEHADVVLIFKEEEKVQLFLSELTKVIPSFVQQFSPRLYAAARMAYIVLDIIFANVDYLVTTAADPCFQEVITASFVQRSQLWRNCSSESFSLLLSVSRQLSGFFLFAYLPGLKHHLSLNKHTTHS